MKVNMQLLKLIIRVLILLILFVMLFLISAFLYSGKYWPDVYNYINANITIKRIPTLSELNITILESPDFTTEGYFTTDVTETTDFDDFTETVDDFFSDRKRRGVKIEDMAKDYIELPKHAIVHYVFEMEELTTKAMIDSVDETKMTLSGSKDVEVMNGSGIEKLERLTNDTSNPASIFPWVAAIFIKNGTSNQFDYFCDGVLLSNTVVLTAARCVLRSRAVVDPEDVIVFLGKRSLRTTGEGESIHKVQQIKLQDNFTFFEHHAANDLAAIQLESPAVYTDDIQAACLAEDEDVAEAVTTAWGENLSLIHFVKTNTTCEKNSSDNVVCAVYGNDVTLCPSYGGAYASRSNTDSDWCLRGIRTDDPTDKGLCFDKSTTFTDLIRYTPWLDDILL